MPHVDALLARHFPGSGSELVLAGLPVSSIVARFGTPLFVYDAGALDRQWNGLRRALPQRFSIVYSVKANPNPAFLRYFLSRGAGLEIASGGEFALALTAGCPPERILFAGPGKTEEEIELVLKHGRPELHVESPVEAERVGAISRRLGLRARVGVRVNPGGEAEGGALRMGGKAAPFGVDEEDLDRVVDHLEADPFVELRGLHLFSGTQILDHTVLVEQYAKGVELGRRLAQRLGRPLATLDFGGGLGIPYLPTDRELDMTALAAGLERLVAGSLGDPLLAGTRFVIEPGRYLVGESGVYVVRVTDVKRSRGKTFVVADGGMHHHLAAAGHLGQVIKRNFPIAVLNRLGEPAGDPVDVVGPLCTPLDTLARDAALPRVAVGDLLGVFQSGAYALSASPTRFLSHPSPPEVLVSEGQARLIRRRGRHDDLLHDLVD